MEYKDYYDIMGLNRDATQDEIKRAYRKLARRYHPDVSTEADAEARFKDVGEAYEVLKDPEKRAAYDQLGNRWQAGQEFKPPPGWDAGFEYSGSGRERAQDFGTSDFFEELFGRARAGRAGPGFRQESTGSGFSHRGEDHHARVMIDVEDSYQGASRAITLQVPEVTPDGHVRTRNRTLNVKIPKGVRAGQQIRLAGQGGPGLGEAKSGDLYLEVDFRPNDRFRVEGSDVSMTLPVAPWEAALGATMNTQTPSGPVDLKIPPNSQAGRKLRLKGRGLPSQPPGDLYVELVVVLPPARTEAEKAVYQQMKKQFTFNPRSDSKVKTGDKS